VFVLRLRASRSSKARIRTTDSVKVRLDVLRPVFGYRVVVLDELGAVKPTEWCLITFRLILHTAKQQPTTIITTNYRMTRRAFQFALGVCSGCNARRGRDLETGIGERLRSLLPEMCRSIKMEARFSGRTRGRASRR